MTSESTTSTAAARTVNRKVEPTPTWLLTAISPPMSSTRWRQIISPRPVPP